MAVLTRFILLLTLIALLPLGSFPAKSTALLRAAPAISAVLEAIPPSDTSATAQPAQEIVVQAKKRCPARAIPGSLCNPALADWPAAPVPGFDPSARRHLPGAWPDASTRSPAPPRDPPRLG